MAPMSGITRDPWFVSVLSFAVLWLSARLGRSVLRKRIAVDEDIRQDFDLILAAALTLLGLTIGFTFSMATSRYDQRKNLEEEEANAIGTEYVRADLLPAADGAKVRPLLKKYLDERIHFYEATNEDDVEKITVDTSQIQGELWSAILGPAAAQPTPIVALAVSGMNDVLNSQGYTQAAWLNRIPVAAWGMMLMIAVGSNLLVGYGSRGAKSENKLLVILPLLVSVAFMLIADIDTPRRGIIRLIPQNLRSVAESLGKN
jgi:hypothetical protein